MKSPKVFTVNASDDTKPKNASLSALGLPSICYNSDTDFDLP